MRYIFFIKGIYIYIFFTVDDVELHGYQLISSNLPHAIWTPMN